MGGIWSLEDSHVGDELVALIDIKELRGGCHPDRPVDVHCWSPGGIVSNDFLCLKDTLRVGLLRDIVKVEDGCALDGVPVCQNQVVEATRLEVKPLHFLQRKFSSECQPPIVFVSDKLIDDVLLVHEEESIVAIDCKSKAAFSLHREDGGMTREIGVTGQSLHDVAFAFSLCDVVKEAPIAKYHLYLLVSCWASSLFTIIVVRRSSVVRV